VLPLHSRLSIVNIFAFISLDKLPFKIIIKDYLSKAVAPKKKKLNKYKKLKDASTSFLLKTTEKDD